MVDFICGLALGTAFAPFWMIVWANFIKPTLDKILNKAK